MKPVAFQYIAPSSLQEALQIKDRYRDDAIFLAGGQSLIPTMNFRLTRPEVIIDINKITELDNLKIDTQGKVIRIGALVRHRQLELDPMIEREQPLVSEAYKNVAHPQVRNRGTLCGNLCHADPASEMPAIMLALDARMHLQSVSGERWVDADEFFESVYTTCCEADEMLVGVEVPFIEKKSGSSFQEIARRKGDFAMMGVAAVVTLDAEGNCSRAVLTYCGAGERPIIAKTAASGLVGTSLDDNDIREAATAAVQEIAPTGNVQASADYQKHLAEVLTYRTISVAKDRALGVSA